MPQVMLKFIIDRFVFNGNQNSVKHVLVAGEMIIRDYKHQQEQQITRDFAATMMKLKKLLD